MRSDLTGDRVGAMRIGGDPRPSRTYAAGRTCAEPGCGARLSIYNSGDRCSLHHLLEVPRFECGHVRRVRRYRALARGESAARGATTTAA